MEQLTILCFHEPDAGDLRGFDEIHVAVTIARAPLPTTLDGMWCQRFLSRPFALAVVFEWEWDYEGEAQGQEGSINHVVCTFPGVSSRGGEPGLRAITFDQIDAPALRGALLANEADARRFITCMRSMAAPALTRARAFALDCFRAATEATERLAVAHALVTLGHHDALDDVRSCGDAELTPIIDELLRLREANRW